MSSIVRVEKNKNYTVISNVFLRDKNLTLKAIGLLTLIMSLPEDWDYTIAGLVKICGKDGRDAVSTAVQELIDNGYCHREQLKGKNGKFDKMQYTFFETPQKEKQLSENTFTENPLAENPQQVNTNIVNTDLQSKDSFALQQNSNFSLPSRQNEKKETPTPQSPPPPFAEATKNFKEWFCETFYPQYHEGLKYSFKAARDGKHLKNIIKQMAAQIKSKGKEATDENIFKFLVKCLENFDKADFAWVGEINLGLIDGQFNKFILSAKKMIDAQSKSQVPPQKPSSTMYGDKRDKEEIERENILNDKNLSKEEKQQKLYELSMKKSNHETNTKK